MIQSTVQKLKLWRKQKILEKHNFLEKKYICALSHAPPNRNFKKKSTKNQQTY